MDRSAGVLNALTVDVEEYFQVLAMAPYVPRARWETSPSRLAWALERVLGLCAEVGVQGTFFTLGWVAERHPDLVRRIVAEGHEVASHGYGHQRVGDMTPRAFRRDVHYARVLLEDIVGEAVIGYRAPAFSLGRHTPWAVPILAETGHRYSSSVYPVRHDHYGDPDAPRWPYRSGEEQPLLEVPLTTLRLFGRNWPVAGGGYFRLLPYAASRAALGRVNATEGKPAVFYIHPWELDPGQPRIPGVGGRTRFRHYLNLHRTENRLRRLLCEFRWGRMDQVFARELARIPGPPGRAAAAAARAA
ncbi:MULTISPECIES: XrtA system polysaccharide deacetylase [unclassified Halorhodospira]|uniref:XrtA system polysaccharide deacetylase n=1 Tax=unclassified Halorhodospira TaxID=2626748 RepID=UPI001EE7EF4F|nr:MULTISPECIES: XrtA system polysaccharide deacetylase [unclassified Halorhodospira]MCG5540184.1 DUF3473 domain-containing protein [Halorhodospira sp. M39old]MCG5545115.1 DUF3473 domain-containing protein [Halorhodospira sp. M38]